MLGAEAILGGIVAGLAATAIYEGTKYARNWYFLHFNPLETYFSTPNEPAIYPTEEVAMMFYMKNRTKRYLPVAVGVRGTDLQRSEFTASEQPLAWLGRRDNFGPQEITLAPEEGGNFVFMCRVGKTGDFHYNISLTSQIPLKAKPKVFVKISDDYKFKRIQGK